MNNKETGITQKYLLLDEVRYIQDNKVGSSIVKECGYHLRKDNIIFWYKLHDIYDEDPLSEDQLFPTKEALLASL